MTLDKQLENAIEQADDLTLERTQEYYNIQSKTSWAIYVTDDNDQLYTITDQYRVERDAATTILPENKQTPTQTVINVIRGDNP